MPDAQLSSSLLKKSMDIPIAVGETVRKFKAVVGLDTLYFIKDYLYAMSCVILLLMKDVVSSRLC